MAGQPSLVRSVPGFRHLPDTGDLAFFGANTQYVRSSTGTPIIAADLASGSVTASMAGLATCFTTPVLESRHAAAPPWTDVDRIQIDPPLPDESSDPAELVDRLRATVEALLRDREAPAVVCWPGAASAALLATAAWVCGRTGRRLTVLAPDVEDDLGRQLVPTVKGMMEAVAPEGVLVPVLLPGPDIKPAWAIDGPQMCPWPTVETSAELTATAHGADIMLDVRGGARLLSATPYLASSAIRHGLSDRLPRYLKDLGHPWIHEGLSAVGRIKHWKRARAYWALTWANSDANQVVDVLADHYRDAAEQWTGDLTRHALWHIVRHKASWAQAHLMHRALAITQRIKVNGNLRKVSPYCEPVFAEYAYRLPLLARYNPHRETAYLRRNTLLAGMAPQANGLLATFAPATYRKVAARTVRMIHRDPSYCVEVGLLRSDWRQHCRTEHTLATIASCEQWLAGAAQRGLL